MAGENVHGATQPGVDGLVPWFELDLDRRSSGLYLKAKADKRVEDFIAALGYGQFDPIETYSRTWVATREPLKVYRLATALEGRFTERYTLSAPGSGLDYDGYINLSFLRLVGLSSEGGVSFRMEQPMSRSRVNTIKSQIMDGVGDLLKEFIVPVHINMQLVSKPCVTCHGG